MKVLPLCLCLAACGVRPNPLEIRSMSSTITQLAADTGQAWQIRYQPGGESVAFLGGGHTVPILLNLALAKSGAMAFVLRYRELFGLLDPDDNVVVTGAEEDDLGDIHVRVQQTRRGLPVWGSGLLIHFAHDGSIYQANGASFPIPPLDLTADITSAAARTIATTAAESLEATLDPGSLKLAAPSLAVLPGEVPALVYTVDVENRGDGAPFHSLVLIDAHAGTVIRTVDELYTMRGHGEGYFGENQSFECDHFGQRFYLEDDARLIRTYTASGGTDTPGTILSSASPDSWEPRAKPMGTAVDVHTFVSRTYDYFATVHGYKGWSAAGDGVIRATVHFGQNVTDAFYDGHQLIFGDGDGATYLPPGAALSMVAHEYTHGWLDQAVGLTADGDSAMVHEAFADVFAALVTTNANESVPWQIGFRTRLVNGANQPVRDLENPAATGNPASIGDMQPATDPHTNSTVLSHVAYLMATGPLGVAATERIWYRAAAHYLSPSANFADAADALFSAARDLDPAYVSPTQAALGTDGLVAP